MYGRVKGATGVDYSTDNTAGILYGPVKQEDRSHITGLYYGYEPIRLTVDIAFQVIDGLLLVFDDMFYQVTDREHTDYHIAFQYR